MSYGIFIIVAVCLPLLARPAFAQSDVLAGPVVGYGFGVPLGLDRAPGVINRYDFSGTGTSSNHTFVAGGALLLPHALGGAWGLSARFGYAVSEGMFSSLPFTRREITYPGGDSVYAVQEFTVRSREHLLQADMEVRHTLAGNLSVGAGIWGSYRLAARLRQSETILGPEDAVFAGNLRSRVAAEGDEIASGPVRYGAQISAALGIPLGGSIRLQPELLARLDAAALADDVGLRSLSAGAALAFFIDFNPPATLRELPSPPPPVALVDTISARTPMLHASVDLYVAGEDGAAPVRLRSRSTLHRHYMPLLPAIFFEPGVDTLPGRYSRLAAGAVRTFSVKSLARLPALKMHHHTLDIIGMRMRSEPEAGVTLYGSATTGEPAALARRRAEQVAEYLHRVWQIEPSRMAIRSGRRPYDLGRDGERSVQIASSSDRVLAPVVTEWVERELFAPQLGLARSIRSEAGVRRWDIVVRQGTSIIATYSSAGDEPSLRLDGAFLHHAAGDGASMPIVAELEVEDMVGTMVTASDELPVAAGDRDAEEPVREVLTFTFAGLGLRAPVLERGNATLMRRMIELVRSGAHVTLLDRDAGAGAGDGWRTANVAQDLIAGLKKEAKRVAEFRMVPAELDGWEISLPERSLLVAGAAVVVEQAIGAPSGGHP